MHDIEPHFRWRESYVSSGIAVVHSTGDSIVSFSIARRFTTTSYIRNGTILARLPYMPSNSILTISKDTP